MKELLDRLLKSLGISGRDWAALLLALLLAFSTWLIHNLSLKYNDYLTVSVVAQCNIEGHSNISSNQCPVVARCRATGYTVIRKDIGVNKNVTRVNFSPSIMKHAGGDTFYLTSSDLVEYEHLIFGNDVTVEYYASDTLYFDFPKMDFKRVPVHPVQSVSYRSQYTNVGDLKVDPDSILVYAEPHRLENVSKVYTRPIRHSELDSDIRGVVGLEQIEGVRLSSSEVHYSLDVSRYVEVRAKVLVSFKELPLDKEMMALPSEVEVTLKCLFPMVSDPFENIDLYVRYVDFHTSISGKCPVRVDGLPDEVISYELDPFYVECIVSDR